MTTIETPVKYGESTSSLTTERGYKGSCPPRTLYDGEDDFETRLASIVALQREFIEYFNDSDIKNNIGKLV